jgi:hypothetical protein
MVLRAFPGAFQAAANAFPEAETKNGLLDQNVIEHEADNA